MRRDNSKHIRRCTCSSLSYCGMMSKKPSPKLALSLPLPANSRKPDASGQLEAYSTMHLLVAELLRNDEQEA